jgi:hypothetical protein
MKIENQQKGHFPPILALWLINGAISKARHIKSATFACIKSATSFKRHD